MKAQTFLPKDYRPAEDEPFMNELQLEYFRRKLEAVRCALRYVASIMTVFCSVPSEASPSIVQA